MITILLAISVFVLTAKIRVLEGDDPAGAPSWLKLIGGALGVISPLLAFTVIWSAISSCSSVNPVSFTGGFRTGQLEPFVIARSDSGSRIRYVHARYVQKSWWGLVQDGVWNAKPKNFGGWMYQDGKRWRDVPESVYESANDSTGYWDNRGYHED
ncbi:MAG: hypothetical protein QM627_04810 [Luteolibacter sp.]